MPITENNFTAEELKGALTANPNLLPAIKGVLSQDFKHVVQDETEHEAWKKKYEDETIAPRVSKFAQDIEKDVLELTGIPKLNANEKYYEYQKRAVGAKLKELNEMQDELTRLRANGNPSAADKARIKELEDGITKEKSESKTLREEYEKKLRNLTAGNKIEVAMSAIRANYKKDIDPDLIQTKENVVRAELLAMAQVGEDGAVTFVGPDGKVMTDPATLLPRSEESLLRERLKPLIDTGKQQPGAGSGPGTAGQGEKNPNGTPKIEALPAGIGTKLDLTRHLLKLGFVANSKEFNEAHNRLGKDLPLQ